MQVVIIKSGLLSTLQDQGRIGYRHLGIPVSGTMDALASQIANLLVGNDKNSPVLEITYGDVEMISETGILISHCGCGTTLFADGNELPSWKTQFIPAGTHLVFSSIKNGCRTYVSIAGGWRAQYILDSYSTYLPVKIGGLNGTTLQKGDRLKSNEEISSISLSMLTHLKSSSINYPKWGVSINRLVNYSSKKIRIILHHEFDWFDSDSQEALFSDSFSLSMQSNRMGYQLTGTLLKQKNPKQLLSTAVSKGTIQVTESGSMIMLMADCQTTGGYPRIAQVAAVDLPVCAQLKPGDNIMFEEIKLEDAEKEYVKRMKQLVELEKAIRLRFG